MQESESVYMVFFSGLAGSSVFSLLSTITTSHCNHESVMNHTGYM